MQGMQRNREKGSEFTYMIPVRVKGEEVAG
jgi:hypothetical protein